MAFKTNIADGPLCGFTTLLFTKMRQTELSMKRNRNLAHTGAYYTVRWFMDEELPTPTEIWGALPHKGPILAMGKE